MTVGDRRPGARSIGRARIAQILGLLLCAGGIALLVLPYETAFQVDVPPGSVLDPSQLPEEIPCEPPLADLRHGEPDLWINYTPDDGTTFRHDSERLGGTYCMPESFRRGVGGAFLLLGGLVVGAAATVMARRGRKRGEAPDGEPGALPPGFSSGPG